MPDFKGCHLGTPPAPGRRDRETHLVVDIHETQWSGRVGAGPRDIRALGTQGRKLIADAATRFKGQTGLVYFIQYAIHGILNGS